MRHSTVSSLLEREDVIVVASVSCIYGIGNPEDYRNKMLTLRVGDVIPREEILERLVNMQYVRNDYDIKRGVFRVKGESKNKGSWWKRRGSSIGPNMTSKCWKKSEPAAGLKTTPATSG